MQLGMTDKERACLNTLANAWNQFLKLPEVHSSDQDEFMRAIHAAQNILAYRVAKRISPLDWLPKAEL